METAHKTLIISGSVQPTRTKVKNGTRLGAKYDLALFGQTPEQPTVVYITNLVIECNGYDEMQEAARQKFASYFETSLFNIVSLENFIFLPTIEN